jgi:hypothetical protein
MIANSPRVPFTIFGLGFIFMALHPLTPMTLRHGTARPRRRGVEPLILEGSRMFFYTVGGIFGRKGIGGCLILSKRTSCRWKWSVVLVYFCPVFTLLTPCCLPSLQVLLGSGSSSSPGWLLDPVLVLPNRGCVPSPCAERELELLSQRVCCCILSCFCFTLFPCSLE